MERITIQKAGEKELDLVEEMYNEAIDWLNDKGIRQWKRGVYPTRSSAQEALEKGNLYCCYADGRLAGTLILNEVQPPQYAALAWKYEGLKTLVLHTLIVRPRETGKGIARSIMEYVLEYGRQNGYECIRLDAYPDNSSAVGLYRSFGFEFVGKVFFEYKEPPYQWYDCFERLI